MSSSASSAPSPTGRTGGGDDGDGDGNGGGGGRKKGTLSAPADTRLVTIVAHVDHGKTTLADHLVESNGIIGERHAGTMRYLDSGAEEQRRGITMRASAIALRHRHVPPPGRAKKSKAAVAKAAGDRLDDGGGREMVVHLVDSPGHVDFGSEVTSSLLACDGALLVVDVVEGMCARTHAVLREAHANQLVPVLVLNKVDRLCTELHLSVGEAYVRIRELVESVNAASAAMLAASEASAATGDEGGDERTEGTGQRGGNKGADDGDGSSLSAAWNFDPAGGNVVFASALHGWGFTIPALARSLFRSKVLDIKPQALRQFLFGDFRYKADGHKVVKWKQPQAAAGDDDANAPMFAEFGLRPLWDIYEGVGEAAGTAAAGSPSGVADQSQRTFKISAGSPGMDRALASMQLGSTAPPSPDTSNVETLLPRSPADVQAVLSRINATSEEGVLRALLKRYRPLSDAVLDAACEVCPSPAEATSTVRTRALALREPASSELHHSNFGEIRRAVRECDAGGDSPTVAHVCKFMAVKAGDISDPESAADRRRRRAENGGEDEDSDDGDRLMALVRVLSGNLTSEDGVEYEVYGPKYDGGGAVPKREIKAYLLMGASLVRVKSVPAGHICAVSNLEDLQLKTMTLCDRKGGMPLRGFDSSVKPLVKVNVEAAKASDTSVLEQGLLKLSLADAAVEVTATSKGERLLACQGELHLEQSILDLKQAFCTKPIDLRISDPIVDFGESTDWFEGEGDFKQFFNSQMPPLRQTSIPPYCDEEGLANARHGRCRAILSGRGAAISVRVVPLARSVYECIKEGRVVDGSEEDILYMAGALQCPSVGEAQSLGSAANIVSALSKSVCSFDSHGNCIVESLGVAHGDCVKAVVSNACEVYISPKQNDGKSIEPSPEMSRENGDVTKEAGMHEDVNTKHLRTQYEVLQQRIRSGTHTGGFDQDTGVNETGVAEADADEVAADLAARSIWSSEMRGSAVAGFQLAMRAGPLCEEPIKGVMVILEAVEIAMARKRKNEAGSTSNDSRSQPTFAPAQPISGGMVVSAIRQGIRLGLLTRPARIVEGHVRLTLHSSLSALGPIYAVLSKRRGKVISDEMVDGTDLLSITAALPQTESFGLFQELLSKTSGDVTAPELVFSHYELLKEDPFWIPTSEDEREEFGEIIMNGDASTGVANNALSIIRCVRKRKGLLVDSTKIVVAAEKQRTLARKK